MVVSSEARSETFHTWFKTSLQDSASQSVKKENSVSEILRNFVQVGKLLNERSDKKQPGYSFIWNQTVIPLFHHFYCNLTMNSFKNWPKSIGASNESKRDPWKRNGNIRFHIDLREKLKQGWIAQKKQPGTTSHKKSDGNSFISSSFNLRHLKMIQCS